MKLTTLGRRKFEKLIDDMSKMYENPQTVESEFRSLLLTKISSIFETGDLPVLDKFLEFNETSEVVARHFNEVQQYIYEAIRDYQGYLYDLGTSINSVLNEVIGTSIEIMRKKEEVLALIRNIENAVINNSSSNAIHDELLYTVDFKDNLFTGKGTNVNISTYNAITLPVANETFISVADYSFKVENPSDATNEFSILSHNITGMKDEQLFKPGYFEGKFFGSITDLNDIRMNSQLKDIFNIYMDKQWEIEYVSNMPVDKLRLSLIMSFTEPVALNTILMLSKNDIEAYYRDTDTGEFVFIYDYFNEWYKYIKTDKIKYIIYGNTPAEIVYSALCITKNNNIIYTYSYIETLFRKRPDLYNKYFIEYESNPIPEVEISSRTSEERLIDKKKYRTAVSIESLNHILREYKSSGLYITNEINAGRQIRSIEIYSNSFIPTETEEYIKYEVSFDGKTWYVMRSMNDSLTAFNNKYPSRIVLSEVGSAPDYLFLKDVKTNTYYLRVNMTSKDKYVTPAIYSLKIRVKY